MYRGRIDGSSVGFWGCLGLNSIYLIPYKTNYILIRSDYFRERRMRVTDEDFKKSKENVLYRKNEGTPEGLYL